MLHKIDFQVVHATSQDEQYPASELNNPSPSTKGWRSAKNCLYPQQIVIKLGSASRIQKIQLLSHQYLIASKVELFVGDSYGEDTINLNTSRFHRLGHVELSNNEVTQFKTRELKSVYVNARCSYFQIFLYKNFPNERNLHNQISLIALNFIGESRSSSPVDLKSNGGIMESVKRISPSDDLASCIYQDPHLWDIVRRLKCQKLEYARQENFEMARKTRDAIHCIQEAGEQIYQLEFEKQEAAKLENYEEAQVKKERIARIRDELSRNIDLDSLLSTGSRPPYCTRPIMYPNKSQTTFKNSIPSSIESEPRVDLGGCLSDSTASSGDAFPARPWSNVADERPLPALLKKQTNNSNTEATQLEYSESPRLSDEHQGLSEATILQATVSIDVVGLPLVHLFYSRSWRLREQGLVDLEKRVSRDPLPPPASLESVSSEPDPIGELRSTTFLLLKALNEQVLTLYRKALEMIKPTIADFGERHNIAKPEIVTSIGKIFHLLLQRTGDSSLRIRDVTKTQLIEMTKLPIFQQSETIWHEILRPFRPTTLERLALSQTEILSQIYTDCGNRADGRSKFPLIENLIIFTVQALEHRSNEVRELAEDLIVALYKAEDRNQVRRFMPPNDWEAQRQPLYRRIFAKFDKLDGRDHLPTPLPPSRSVSQRKHAQQASPKCQHRGRSQPNLSPRKKVTTPGKPSDLVSTKSLPVATASELDLLLSLDKTCIFCGEQNDEFDEKALDMHYWRACPMLRRCPNCKQVVEVSGLTSHLLNECPESNKLGGFRRCGRCSEAVPIAAFITHNSCKAAPNPALRCPLCHVDLPDNGVQGSSNEETWRAHLLEECSQNSRIPRPPLPLPSPVVNKGLSTPSAMLFPGKKAVVKRDNAR